MSSRASRSKRSPGFPERVSKAATIAAVALALPLQLWVDPATSVTVWLLAVGGFGVALVCGQLWEAMTARIVFAAGLLLPALLTATLHVAALNAYYSVWLAAMFGAIVPMTSWSGWQLPRDWRIPIGVWALTLAVSWPVLIARETGLRLATLRDPGALDSWANLNVPQVESWILHVVLAQLVGLLWLEWQASSNEAPRVADGIWIGASIASLVALYQGAVDASFLSGGPWPELRRAAGTLVDANAYGTIAAIAGPLGFVSIPRLGLGRALGRTAQAGVLALNWAGVWMSGSRTALVCGVCATAFLVLAIIRGERSGQRSGAMPAWLAGGLLSVLLVAIGAGAIGPLGRISDGLDGSRASLRQLWTRGGYGTVALQMVREHPLVGVGVGSFNWMAPDYWRRIADAALPFDNAQNWWRHQLAEFGILGALPVLFWSALVVWYVLTRRSPPEDRVESEAMRGLLVGVGVASLVGMPTQNPIVLLAFFSIVARFDRLTRPRVRPAASAERSTIASIRQGVWIAGLVLALVYAEGHLALARGSLGPVERATLANRDFVVGAYPPEAQSNGQFRWIGRQANFLLRAPSRYLVIRYRIEHPDAQAQPVNFQISTRCQTLVDEFRSDAATGTMALELGERQTYMQFDTEVSRTWRPSDFGRPDTRQLGAAIETAFVTGPEQVSGQVKWVPLLPCGPI